ncbi:hypothetical protein BDW66DRAFT_5493 [Aspergillus desertorum]
MPMGCGDLLWLLTYMKSAVGKPVIMGYLFAAPLPRLSPCQFFNSSSIETFQSNYQLPDRYGHNVTYFRYGFKRVKVSYRLSNSHCIRMTGVRPGSNPVVLRLYCHNLI